MNKRKSSIVLAFVVLFLSISAGYGRAASDEKDSCFSTKWPHEMSDLQAAPRLIFGRLKNGFRYVLMKNQEPRNRVGMYLDVRTGSLNENGRQRGIAHFLEHMVFNGSTHFKPGELIDYFQSLGMSFGGDTNAQTGYRSTIYTLALPTGTKEEIEKGLLVFSDYSRGALLLQTQIDKERGVILSEKRTRDSAAYRTMEATSAFTLKGTRLPERFPIGITDVINKADHNLIEGYYRTWYRPNDMILVMVGDFDPVQTETLIKQDFSTFVGKGPQPQCPDFGRVHHFGVETFYHYEPETGSTHISLETLWNERQENDTLALEVQELKKNLASEMINHRLEKMAEDPKTPFVDSGYSMGNTFRHIGFGEISATTDPGKWQAALKGIEHTLRQALQYGFSDTEFQRVKKEFKASLDSAVLTSATRDSMALAREIVSDLNDNSVFQSPEQQKKIFEPIIDHLTLAEVQKAFADVWAHDNRLVEVTGNVKIASGNPRASIEEVYQQAVKETVGPLSAQRKVIFPYLKSATLPVKPVSDVRLSSVGAERLVFADGVVLNLKKTNFKKNVFAIRVDFGHGKLTEPVPGLAMLAQSVVNGSGSGRLTESDLERVLTGSTVDLHFQVGESSFYWQGGAVTKDMELLFQVLQTVLDDPGIRADAYRVSMDNLKQMYSKIGRNIDGGFVLHVRRFLAGGYPHAGLPPWADFSQLSLSQVRSWLIPAMSTRPLEISVVGDFDRDRLVGLVGKYLGDLAERKPVVKTEAAKIVFPMGKHLLVKVASSINKAMVVVAWPTADFWDIGRTRRLNILASIFSDRLRKEVREHLGASYSPEVFNAASRVFPGYGLLQAVIIVDPGQVDRIRDVVLKIGDDLRSKGCTADELERAKAPTITSIKDMVRTNTYWLDTVLALSERHPQQLQWPETILHDFNSITPQEIDGLAKAYLDRDRAAVAIIEPDKGKEKR